MASNPHKCLYSYTVLSMLLLYISQAPRCVAGTVMMIDNFETKKTTATDFTFFQTGVRDFGQDEYII